ncbi:MAG: N-acetyltransferase [Bacteroidetes bacterium]|jgi:diamine N-acetyltransferase|nr:N-acetyltransferase [Bacteroidota bacterium]MDF2451359.1 N-acetyltransferase [Bacteroidota bacterium]
MFIRSEHIYLRALESGDLNLLYSFENDQSIWKVSNTLSPFSKDVLELYLHSAHQDIYTNKQLRLMICLVETNEAIGTIDLFEFEPLHLRVGVGVLIFEGYRKKGHALEALQLINAYAKNTLLLHQLFCNISAGNMESIALFEKCGFKKAGVKKDWNRVSGHQFEDEFLYQLIL